MGVPVFANNPFQMVDGTLYVSLSHWGLFPMPSFSSDFIKENLNG